MIYEITGVMREGDTTLTSGSDGLTWGYTESYHVIGDEFDPTTTMGQVLDSAIVLKPEVQQLMGYNNGVQTDRLPFPSVTVDRDGLCVCKSLSGQRDERNPRKWIFTADWSSRVDDSNTGQHDGNPNSDPEQFIPFRETLFEPITRARTRDLAGLPYINGAGNIYTPPMEVDDELPRWDFTQIEPAYVGLVAGYYTTYNALTASGRSKYAVLTQMDDTSDPGTFYPPGIYVANYAGEFNFFAPTDATMLYFNGCINQYPFIGYPSFTLLLKVRSSKLGTYFGRRRRVTEYSIIYDERNHWDKPENAGPFFIAPKLDDSGNDDPVETVAYPYIYYTNDIEDESTDLVVDEAGPLGIVNNTLSINGSGVIIVPPYTDSDALPTGKGNTFLDRVAKVKHRLADGTFKWFYRAYKGGPDRPRTYREYVNHNLLNFGDYLRIVQ